MAEVLAVVVLLVLAVNTGATARDLSAQIDRNALADLAESDPLEVCITGTTEPVSNSYRIEGPLQLVPTFKWQNGTTVDGDHDWFCVFRPPKGQKDNSMFSRHDNHSLLDDVTLAAMYKCGMIEGHADEDEFAQAIRNNTVAQLASRDVAGAREDLIYTRRLTIDGQAFDVPLLKDHPMFCRLGACEYGIPDTNISDFRRTTALTVAAHFLSPTDTSLERIAVQMVEEGGAYLGGGVYLGVVWMWLTPAIRTDRHMRACMAKHAKIDVERALQDWRCGSELNEYSIEKGTGPGRGKSPKAFNISIVELQVSGFNRRTLAYPYMCRAGTAKTGNFTAMQSKLSVYKTPWKAALTTTLFVSMTEQTYDDVYAVYTGILGALFGAFALLVTTLFVYLVAALKRSFVF